MPVLFRHGAPKMSVVSDSRSHHSGPSQPEHLRPSASQKFHRADSQASHSSTVIHRTTSGAPQEAVPLTPKQKFKKVFKKLYRKYHIKYLFPLVFIMVYMFVGAIVFLWLEGSADERRKLEKYETYIREKELLLKRMEEIVSDRAAENAEQRRTFLEVAVDHFHRQLGLEFNVKPTWDFATAMYFSGTLVTTIGYGDVACETRWGQFATIIYAIFGIPIMLITLNDLGKFLYKNINNVIDKIRHCLDWVSRFMRRGIGSGEDKLEIMERGEAGAGENESARRVSFNLRSESEDLNLEVIEDDGSVPLENIAEEEVFVNDMEEDELLQPQKAVVPRMPVLAAVAITVGWIFFSAFLFQLWEDWTYPQSLYFMFISLLTIGLGDVSVERRDIMVICFVLVIVGLSLVSMCINVIQAAIEDLYSKLLMKLLLEYQAKLAQGGDAMGASVGMMQMWGKNRAAKYLMPLLSAEKRRTAMARVQEEARETGIEIPAVFDDMDEKTGMPKILQIRETIDEDNVSAVVEELVRSSQAHKVSCDASRITSPTIVLYDDSTQTDYLYTDDKNDQTVITDLSDSGIQTDSDSVDLSDQSAQCDSVELETVETQTTIVEFTDAESMTPIKTFLDSDNQTAIVLTMDEELQTHIVDFLDMEQQTEIVEKANIRIQTPYQEFEDVEVQTEPSEFDQRASKMSRAKKRLRRAFRKSKNSYKRRSSHGDAPAMSGWRDVDEEILEEDETESSYDSLDWDPIDGMHAERQRKVKDLTRMFDSFRRKENPNKDTSSMK
uniref:Ion channel n=1 Tax=Steinernema glaseri TaxID=37863 RepID=A0A1I8A7W0_9BILA